MTSTINKAVYAKGTRILMADGSTQNIENLHTRFQVVDPSGNSRTITSFTNGVGMMYKITVSNGIEMTVGIDHLLYIINKAGNTVAIPLRYLLEHAWDTYESNFLLIQQSIPAFVNRRSTLTHTPPYIAGLILGRIFLNSKLITEISKTPESTPDDTAWKAWVASLSSLPLIDAYKQNTGTLKGDGLILNCDPSPVTVAVPDSYKYQALPKRCALLAGLLDSCGQYNASMDYYKLSHVSPQLVADSAFLSRSVGLKVTEDKNNPATIQISGNLQILPCRIQGRVKTPAITDVIEEHYPFKIQPLGEQEYCSFTLDGSGMYMLDSFIVGKCGVSILPEDKEEEENPEEEILVENDSN